MPLVVVSGASSGIGAATAKLLGRHGWRVALIARNKEALNRVALEIPQGQAFVFAVDASDPVAISKIVAQIISEHGVPQVLVNSAGAGVWRFIEETTDAEFQQMVNAPFLAAYQLTRAFMAPMLKRRSGQIIQVNSPVSNVGWPGATGYTATRWAMRGLHEALRLDLYGTGVISSHVVFGKVKSEYFVNNPGSEERLPLVARIIPVISPEQCASVIFKTIRSPKSEVIYPFMLKGFYLFKWLCPWLVRMLAIRSGRRH